MFEVSESLFPLLANTRSSKKTAVRYQTTKLLFLAAFLFSIFSGCVAPQPRKAVRKATFIEEEYAKYRAPGTCTITGQAFLKTRGGDVKFGAGNEVHLNPVTSYSTEWYTSFIQQGRLLEDPDSRAMPFHKVVRADGNGRFKFTDLPPGDYYLACPIYWEIPSQYGLQQTGGWAHQKVSVSDGKSVDTVLTR